ncbi:MAG: tetratricopeptide repeat protein, partial [Candidatus Zixiibacteriota bacterium]
VKTVGRMDGELKDRLSGAADETERENAMAAMRTAADSGVTFFAIAIAVQPEKYRAYEGTGLIYDRMEDYDSSLVYYKRAFELAPDSLSNIQNVAYAYIQLEDWQNSITFFHKVLKLVPNEPNILFNIAICFSNLEQSDSAYRYNTMAIAADSSNSMPYIQVGQYFLLKSQTYSDSITHYQKADNAEQSDKFITLRNTLLDSSSHYLNFAVEMEPENITALMQYGLVNMVLGRNEPALEAYQKLAELEPYQKEHWISIGDCLLRLEKFTEAIDPYEKAVEVDPGDLAVWELLLDLYRSEKMDDKVKEAAAKIEELKNL